MGRTETVASRDVLQAQRSHLAARMGVRAQVCGGLAACVGVLALVGGWWLGYPAFASWVPGAVTMKANLALGIAVSALVLIGAVRGWPRGVMAGGAALTTALGFFTMLEYLIGSRWSGLDELLAAEAGGAVDTAEPGRMALNSAFCLLLFGVAGMLLAFGRAAGVRQWLAAIATSVATVALLGWLLGVQALSEFGAQTTRMAVPTALSFLLLGIGYQIAVPQRGWATVFVSPVAGGRIARVWTPAALLVFTAVFALTQNRELSWTSDLIEQIGIAAVVLMTAAGLLVLAGRTSRLDEARLETAYAAAERSEDRYRLLVESAAVAMMLGTPEGHFTEVNDAACRFFGLDAEALTQLAFPDITPQEYLDAEFKNFAALVEGRIDSYRMVKHFIHADGHTIWGDLTVSCVRDQGGRVTEIIGQIIDVTAEVEARQQIAEQNEQNRVLTNRYQSLFEASADALLMVDRGGPHRACQRPGRGDVRVFDRGVDRFRDRDAGAAAVPGWACRKAGGLYR